MPTLLSDLINAIPVAGRADVISPESHNSVRNAIVAIVTELGGAVESRNVTLTFAPTFLEVPGVPRLSITIGLATAGNTGNQAGWLPLQLPDGSQIQQLRVVFGGSAGLSMDVKLQRQFIRGATSAQTLANVKFVGPVQLGHLKEETAPFSADPVEHPQADRVNNHEWKYLVRADLDLANIQPPGSFVNIFAIKVDCRLG